MNTRLTLGIAAAAWLACTGAASAADLTVTLSNVGASGNVRVALYNKAENFPGGERFQGREVAPAAGSVQVVFKDVPPGDYAVSAFQDLNGNQKLDTNSVGLPIEPVGFSSGARVINGPPAFADARFHMGAAARTESVILK